MTTIATVYILCYNNYTNVIFITYWEDSMKKNITIYDIAKECGVSTATVSRVINGGQRVKKETVTRVNKVIDKYKFSPSSVARAMANHKTNTLCVVIPDIANPYFSSLFVEIERYALANHYSTILYNTFFGGASRGVDNPFSELQYFQKIKKKEVDGVIITGGEIDRVSISDEYYAALNSLAKAKPVVVIGQKVEGLDCIFIDRNQGGGFSSLVNHLLVLGNTRIGFVGGKITTWQTKLRYEAYCNTLRSRSLPIDDSLIEFSDYYVQDGYSAMNKLLSKGAPLDAAVAINDAVAIGAIRAINDHGLSCPKDIGIVSGDQFFESDFVTPRLTSLNQQNDYLGRMSIATLISAINGIYDPIKIEHSPQLIVRESCGAKATIYNARNP